LGTGREGSKRGEVRGDNLILLIYSSIRCGNKAAIMDLPSTDLDKCILLTYEAAVRPEVSNITKRTPDYFL
jgi:hypothetical protein